MVLGKVITLMKSCFFYYFWKKKHEEVSRISSTSFRKRLVFFSSFSVDFGTTKPFTLSYDNIDRRNCNPVTTWLFFSNFRISSVLICALVAWKKVFYRMKFGLALYFISMLLIIQPDAILSCDTANWWASLDKKGWSVCPNDRTFLKGLWRNDPSGNNGLWLIEEGKCCGAKEPSYANQPSTCTNANWWSALDRWVVLVEYHRAFKTLAF